MKAADRKMKAAVDECTTRGWGRTTDTLSTPGLDNTRLFISFTAGAGTRCMSLLSSSPSLETYLEMKEETTTTASNRPAFSPADISSVDRRAKAVSVPTVKRSPP